jgi:molybdate transport system substrate-binding protein
MAWPYAPMTVLRRLFVLAAVLLAFAGPAVAQPALTVFAAASLRDVMDAQAAAFARAGGPAVRFSYAASSAIARQIENGAPADVFISADSDWMDYVAQRGLIDPGSRRDLVTNHLALIAPADSKTRLTIRKNMDLLAALKGGRLSMAGPDVPAGRYGRAALTSLGVWRGVEDRVVQADNVRNAMVFVSRGEAPLGVVYDTDARVDPKVRIVGLFPDNSHPRIVYPGAVTKSSTNPASARLMAFLRSRTGQEIFRRYGFTPL